MKRIFRSDPFRARGDSSPLHIQAGTAAGRAYYENLKRIFHTGRPFLARYGCLPKDYEAMCQQALTDIQQPGFSVTWNLLSARGTKARAHAPRARD